MVTSCDIPIISMLCPTWVWFSGLILRQTHIHQYWINSFIDLWSMVQYHVTWPSNSDTWINNHGYRAYVPTCELEITMANPSGTYGWNMEFGENHYGDPQVYPAIKRGNGKPFHVQMILQNPRKNTSNFLEGVSHILYFPICFPRSPHF